MDDRRGNSGIKMMNLGYDFGKRFGDNGNEFGIKIRNQHKKNVSKFGKKKLRVKNAIG